MVVLTNEQQKEFDVWLKQYIKESGHDFVFGFYVILEGDDKMIHISDPKYGEWFELKKKEFLSNKLRFRVWYDDDAFAIISKVSERIEQFGLEIINIEGINDGFEDFEIKKINI